MLKEDPLMKHPTTFIVSNGSRIPIVVFYFFCSYRGSWWDWDRGELCNTAKVHSKWKLQMFYKKIIEKLQSLERRVIKAEFLDQSLKNSNSNTLVYIFCCYNSDGEIFRGCSIKESRERELGREEWQTLDWLNSWQEQHRSVNCCKRSFDRGIAQM